MVTKPNATCWNCDTFSYKAMAWGHETKQENKLADAKHIVPEWGRVLGRNVIIFKLAKKTENPFPLENKSLAPSNLTSQRIVFQKNSINGTHQHITKYIPQQHEACRSLFRSNLEVCGKKTWLKRAEMQKNKRGPMRVSTAVQRLCDWWVAGRLKPWLTSLNYLPRTEGTPWDSAKKGETNTSNEVVVINASLKSSADDRKQKKIKEFLV